MNADKVERYVGSVVSALHEAEKKGMKSVARQISTLVRQAGKKRRSVKLMAAYAEEFERREVYCDLDLEEMDLSLKARVNFSLSEFPAPWPEFSEEKTLEAYMARHLPAISNALPGVGKLYLDHGGSLPQKIFHLEGDSLKPDMVLHTQSGRRVVVELKKGSPGIGAVNQLTRYMTAVARHHRAPEKINDNPQKCIVGLLFTGRATSKALSRQLQYDLVGKRNAGFDIHWACYELDFKVTNMTTDLSTGDNR